MGLQQGSKQHRRFPRERKSTADSLILVSVRAHESDEDSHSLLLCEGRSNYAASKNCEKACYKFLEPKVTSSNDWSDRVSCSANICRQLYLNAERLLI